VMHISMAFYDEDKYYGTTLSIIVLIIMCGISASVVCVYFFPPSTKLIYRSREVDSEVSQNCLYDSQPELFTVLMR